MAERSGSEPFNLLPAQSAIRSRDRRESVLGSVPTRWWLLKLKSVSAVHRPSWLGTVPWSVPPVQCPSSSRRRTVNLPIDDGSVLAADAFVMMPNKLITSRPVASHVSTPASHVGPRVHLASQQPTLS